MGLGWGWPSQALVVAILVQNVKYEPWAISLYLIKPKLLIKPA